MKSIPLITLIVIHCCGVSAQDAVVSVDRMNVAYVGISNPITILVEDYNPKLVIASTDNGSIENMGSGKYNYTPAKTGDAIISLSVKLNKRTKAIGNTRYRISEIPMPVAYLYYISRGILYIYQPKELKVRSSLPDFNLKYMVLDYKIDISKDKKIVYSGTNHGGPFENEVKYNVGNMRTKDRMHIYKIHCIGPDKKEIFLSDEIYEGF